ncbi:MAG: protease HtpX [Candidatus Obscuribacterales bacterium]|nr:protease HtpX [Candidatus Obscuribacterales bacterium]
MTLVKRIFLFLALNFLVVITMSTVLGVLGVQPYLRAYGLDYTSLAIFCLLWGFVGSFISLLLSKQIAKWSYGVQIIDPSTNDSNLRELVAIVHGLCQRAGIKKMPEVGIYPSDDINAFATGATKNSSLVAVSSGLLHYMDRDEIEGVLGHEISHIANGDMVTMTLLQGVVNAFCMFLSRAIAFALTMGRNNENNAGSSFAYMITRFVLDFVFMLLGSILVAAFSRYREYRADEGGGKLAGKQKMIRALEKLKSQFEHIEPKRGPVSAMMISNKPVGLTELLFSTHPPLDDRIRRLEENSKLPDAAPGMMARRF